ncbi:hypothetical protein DL93DRAFT_1678784 [Clavulina sp. PMI_390]|nr:hypothetical protein DL93DRAFT_1678784 [Clavulina sp. PMI_390]
MAVAVAARSRLRSPPDRLTSHLVKEVVRRGRLTSRAHRHCQECPAFLESAHLLSHSLSRLPTSSALPSRLLHLLYLLHFLLLTFHFSRPFFSCTGSSPDDLLLHPYLLTQNPSTCSADDKLIESGGHSQLLARLFRLFVPGSSPDRPPPTSAISILYCPSTQAV